MRGRSLFILALTFAAGMAHAAGTDTLRIGDAYARASYGQTRVAAAYLRIENQGTQPDSLLAITTPAAEKVEIHTNDMQGDVMRMHPLTKLDVPARGTVMLAPGGTHLMLFRLKEPLVAGMQFPVKLRFEQGGERQVNFTVR